MADRELGGIQVHLFFNVLDLIKKKKWCTFIWQMFERSLIYQVLNLGVGYISEQNTIVNETYIIAGQGK